MMTVGLGKQAGASVVHGDEMDVEKMYPNCITSTVLASARIPCVVASDKEAIQICIKTCNKIDINHARVVRIANSLHVDEIMLSESYYEDVKNGKYPGVEALDEPGELEFDKDGNMMTLVRGQKEVSTAF